MTEAGRGVDLIPSHNRLFAAKRLFPDALCPFVPDEGRDDLSMDCNKVRSDDWMAVSWDPQ